MQSRSVGRSNPASPARRTRGAGGRRRYHHGALREALLDAAEAVLVERGVEGFTLRECARRAGVSHAAPAHHFGDARGLLTAFATRAFERLVARMQRYRREAPADALAQLGAVGQAYLDFAVGNRAQFLLMFRRDRLNQDDPALQAASQAAFAQLRETLAVVVRAQGGDERELSERLLLAWSAVHGFAVLLLENGLEGFRRGQSPAAFARSAGAKVLRLLGTGLAGRSQTA